ncbi:MAG: hypothetical protein KGI60_00455 [Patescibacteria group bacterium]|nr:hypothetical protein [Patescibacteria group bacterium]
MEKHDELYRKKWRKFQQRAWLFRFIPFVDFVFAAGSLATGNVHEASDFDVIVGARQGRIFTVRFFCFLVFKPLGLWARHPDHSKDRICFNHFVTPYGYRLRPPHNAYWQNLYASLIPVYGNPRIMQRFWRANRGWMKGPKLYEPMSDKPLGRKSWIAKLGEAMLAGRFGTWVELKLKNLQLETIASDRNHQEEYKPRIIISDDELEFHPHTKRIEEYSA